MKSLTVEKIAKMLNAEIIGNNDVTITGVASLDNATEYDLSFLSVKKFYNKVLSSKASIVIVPKDFNEELPDGKTWLKCEIPNMAFSKVINYFAPKAVEYKTGIHSTAIIAETAKVDKSCHIGAYVVIAEGAVIGKNTKITSGVFVGENVKIGQNCLIYQGVAIRERCEIGNNVIIHCGVTIGADGFSYTPTPLGLAKVPQVGIVIIEDEVEIGANSTIDRARFGKTWIKTGVKIDNLVHIAHNAEIGEFSLLIGQTGIAGSSKIGRGVIFGGQAGMSHGLTVGDGAKIAGQAGVTKNVPADAIMAGTTAEPAREFMKRERLPKTVDKMKKQIKELEATVNNLKNKIEKV